MEVFKFTPRGVCSREIEIGIADAGETIESVRIHGGCSGNTSGLASLCSGMKIWLISRRYIKKPALTAGSDRRQSPPIGWTLLFYDVGSGSRLFLLRLSRNKFSDSLPQDSIFRGVL